MNVNNDFSSGIRQQGVTTLAVALMLLFILTTGLLFATNVGFFEQRTTVAEMRAKLAAQSAESSMNLAIEYVKSKSALITSTATGGWMNTSSTLKWAQCTNSIAVCLAEENTSRRAASWYIASLPITGALETATQPMVTAVSLSGSSTVAAASTVGALLCQFEGSDAATTNPCVLNPTTPGTLVITLVTSTTIGTEQAESEVKARLATFRTIGGGADAPLIASGTVTGLGSMEIVAAPNGGGPGVPVSVWSPCPVDLEVGTGTNTDPLCVAGSGGVGSVITCHLGDYLGTKLPNQLLDTSTGCASASNACGCPNSASSMLSGHVGATTREGLDILDVDNDGGSNADITYFPRQPFDSASNNLDDSIFEAIFNKDVVNEGSTAVRTNCSPNTDCAYQAMKDLKPTEVATCAGIPASTGGFYWVTNSAESGNGGNCDLPATVGSPTDPVVIVIEGGNGAKDVKFSGGGKTFGMIFVRSSTTAAKVSGGSNTWFIYGAMVVEGVVDFTGLNLVYSEDVINRINNSPTFNRFGVVPGSWLDAQARF